MVDSDDIAGLQTQNTLSQLVNKHERGRQTYENLIGRHLEDEESTYEG